MDFYREILELVDERLGPHAATHVEMWAKGYDFLQDLYKHGLKSTDTYKEVDKKRKEKN